MKAITDYLKSQVLDRVLYPHHTPAPDSPLFVCTKNPPGELRCEFDGIVVEPVAVAGSAVQLKVTLLKGGKAVCERALGTWLYANDTLNLGGLTGSFKVDIT